MEALLTTFLAVSLVEQGDRMQLLAAECAGRFARPARAAAGLIAAACLNALAAAVAGVLARPLMPFRGATLLVAIALLGAGVGALFRPGAPGVVAYARLGPFLGSGFAGLVLGFGGAAQFLVFALAARSGSVVLATVGATLGAAAAILPAVASGARVPASLRVVRTIVGGFFLLVGMLVALSALRLM